MSEKALTTENRTGRDERSGADRCWIYRDGYHHAQVTFTKPDTRLYPTAVEYMRVLSRQEVEKLAGGEGVDTQQYINSLLRTIEGQRRHIRELQAQLPKAEEPPSFSPNFDERNGIR